VEATTAHAYERPNVGFIRLGGPTQCPGFYQKTNSQGFNWKQRCECCPVKPLIHYLPSELQNSPRRLN